ncbi:hypothetical protein E2C01_040748 [Portunus trituberculatus]|uniref:Uncharacterized protein n=1 Tax=Portunus trituberculatus TaxID=210409 RepID=A0A5B7FRL3_PORTR|nr:hypothetical protein [Portunus trituberculatus]
MPFHFAHKKFFLPQQPLLKEDENGGGTGGGDEAAAAVVELVLLGYRSPSPRRVSEGLADRETVLASLFDAQRISGAPARPSPRLALAMQPRNSEEVMSN